MAVEQAVVLGIETSCDETGVALVHSREGLLAHRLYSQVALHADYGGVVPELASRDHVRKTLPLVNELLDSAGLAPGELAGIAYTAGPGLAGALMVGAAFARSLAWGLDIPAIAVHHMEGHLLSARLDYPDLEPPFLCLLVSGGHTQLVQVAAEGDYQVLGESRDDAVGEAFDKTAKLLELGYPGGPALAALATRGNPDRYLFPRPMLDRPGLEFSFSGLKTHAVTTFNSSSGSDQERADIACAFERAIVDTLRAKTARALEQTGAPTLVVAGGVGANQHLRSTFSEVFGDAGVRVLYPRIEFCTDNGAMIAYAGCRRLLQGQQADLSIEVRPRWALDQIPEDRGQRTEDS